MPPHNPRETVILIAEDEAIIRNLIGRMLTLESYALLTAANGKEALNLCNTFTDPIHLLLTNVKMPLMDGITLMQEVRRVRPDIKTVVMSGEMDHAILTGNRPDAFLRKPFVPPTLLKLIQQVLDDEQPGMVEI